jgi:hypothetical protein
VAWGTLRGFDYRLGGADRGDHEDQRSRFFDLASYVVYFDYDSSLD